jgi:hypothetical protein
MSLTEDIRLCHTIDLCRITTRVPGAWRGRGRRKRLLEKGEVRSSRKIPDLVDGVPATTSRLEAVLDREGVSSDANASVRESIRLYTWGITRRHIDS